MGLDDGNCSSLRLCLCPSHHPFHPCPCHDLFRSLCKKKIFFSPRNQHHATPISAGPCIHSTHHSIQIHGLICHSSHIPTNRSGQCWWRLLEHGGIERSWCESLHCVLRHGEKIKIELSLHFKKSFSIICTSIQPSFSKNPSFSKFISLKSKKCGEKYLNRNDEKKSIGHERKTGLDENLFSISLKCQGVIFFCGPWFFFPTG